MEKKNPWQTRARKDFFLIDLKGTFLLHIYIAQSGLLVWLSPEQCTMYPIGNFSSLTALPLFGVSKAHYSTLYIHEHDFFFISTLQYPKNTSELYEIIRIV